MTLQNGLVHGRKAYLWCDTGFWDVATGELAFCDTKAFEGYSWPFAGTLSTWGSPDLRHAIVEHIGIANPQSLPDLLAVAVDGLRLLVSEGGGGRVAIASYTDRPRVHMIACHDLFPGSGYDPFEPVEVNYFVSCANESAPCKVAMKLGFNPKRMRKVIDAQCSTPWEGHGDLAALGPRVWAGGNVVRLEVGPGGVTSAVERAV